MLSEKKLFLFDIDGTVALGDVLLPGAAEFFQEIKERGGQFVFITNNSCLLYTSPRPRDRQKSRMPSSA